jgi:putative membrane protein
MKTFFAVTFLTAGMLCAQTPHADEAFLKNAAEGGMAEVKFGELAQKDGMSSTVKQFGQRMVLDHSKLNDQVKDLAATKNISLPTSVSIKDEASYKLLQAKSGSSFDKSYIEDMLKDHRADIAAFQKEADSGLDPDIKALASKALPTLQQHLRLAEKAAKELGLSMSTSGGMR